LVLSAVIVVRIAGSVWGCPRELACEVSYVRDHPAVINMVQEGKADLKFITGRIALDELVEQSFRTLINHKDTAVKALVHP
jgi:(R,R)-butanediol dehydrogenase/meso-butanediol dehydrogenase/diacetyl reductase